MVRLPSHTCKWRGSETQFFDSSQTERNVAAIWWQLKTSIQIWMNFYWQTKKNSQNLSSWICLFLEFLMHFTPDPILEHAIVNAYEIIIIYVLFSQRYKERDNLLLIILLFKWFSMPVWALEIINLRITVKCCWFPYWI